MFEYAQEVGIDCHLGTYVDEYFEEEGRAGVIIKGERLEADLLIAAAIIHQRFSSNSRMESKVKGGS